MIISMVENSFYTKLRASLKTLKCSNPTPGCGDPRFCTKQWSLLIKEIKKRKKVARCEKKKRKFSRALVDISTYRRIMECKEGF